MNVISDKPYPNILVEKPSLKIANLLSHIYASSESELTSINQYFYQSIILKKEYPEIAKILKEIAQVEMKHLNLIGEAIFLLGGTPIFADCTLGHEKYWNGNDIYYDKDIKTILEIDVEAERKAIYDYQMLKSVINDIYINNLLSRIILDEQIHLEILITLIKSF